MQPRKPVVGEDAGAAWMRHMRAGEWEEVDEHLTTGGAPTFQPAAGTRQTGLDVSFDTTVDGGADTGDERAQPGGGADLCRGHAFSLRPTDTYV